MSVDAVKMKHEMKYKVYCKASTVVRTLLCQNELVNTGMVIIYRSVI